MAAWSEKYQEGDLITCPICYCDVAKRRKTTHMTNCYKANKDGLAAKGLIRCPLHKLHIFPRQYLNFHLEGNCETAKNQLRVYWQDISKRLSSSLRAPPPDFLVDHPDAELLNDNSRLMLFLLKRDLDGNDISTSRELYPEDNPVVVDEVEVEEEEEEVQIESERRTPAAQTKESQTIEVTLDEVITITDTNDENEKPE